MKAELAEYERQLAVYEEQMKSGWENWSYNEFLDLVTARLDPELNYEKPVCPHCDSDNVNQTDHVTTLVGHTGKIDINHQWIQCSCNNCEKQWTMEYKGDYDHGYNTWYTKDGKLLRGLPTCFETYTYTCKHCGGDVHRHNYNKNTRQETEILSYSSDGSKSFDTYFYCNKCKAEVKCSNEYYFHKTPHHPVRPHDPRKPIKWKIYESVGTVVINDYCATKISVDEETE